ncbi:hypothetical protein M501DRAFT_1000411 [Patellaria atrata CBS 101060]|uniref:Uncharacterized protein n=1 Tax=Patellaria atrata CBS 101060 TaxID=1346257 RepID=A0A9P4VTA0_9PEZI|nr:hypothetical protein M501DRAFT_1000411 [Patellaria atrata CBS 101060]
METSNGLLEAASALQKLAFHQIPEFVLEVYSFGRALTANGRLVEYSVTKFIPDTITLKSIWSSLSPTRQDSLVNKVI